MTIMSLSQAERQEICQVFELFDVDNTGKVNVKEISQVLDSLETNNNRTKFRDALARCKTNELDLESFTRLVTSFRRKENDWKHVFGMFDTENKEYITKQDLERVADSLGETLTKDELEEMMLRASQNNNGKVTFQEFETIMTKNLFSS